MSPTRKRTVYVLLAILVAGHAYDIVTSREHWPFSPYPMYANLQRSRTLRNIRIVGITDTTPPRAITFNATYLTRTIKAIRNGGPEKRPQLEKALRDFLIAYNKGLVYRIERFPRLKAIRAYEDTRRLTADSVPPVLESKLLKQVKLDDSLPTAPATQPVVEEPADTVISPEDADDGAR